VHQSGACEGRRSRKAQDKGKVVKAKVRVRVRFLKFVIPEI